MTIRILDHAFVNHKSEEMICWGCGFVIWRCANATEVESAIVQLGGKKLACGKRWHHQIPVAD
jgi:hypothetical protein